jgi:hypothetical protein
MEQTAIRNNNKMQLSAKQQESTKEALSGPKADYGWLSCRLSRKKPNTNRADSDYGWLS